MSTLHTSEQTNGRVLPQPCPLESVAADNPGVGTKRVTDAGTQLPAPGVQHDRGEIPGGPPAAGDVTTDPLRAGSPEPGRKAHTSSPATPMLVPVVGSDGNPLMPTHPARARKLLAKGRAVVTSRVPFVIRLKDRSITDGNTNVQPVGFGIDPGSKHTGVAVFSLTEDLDRATGELTTARRGLFALQLDHRGSMISKNLTSRAQLRRGRRSRNLRYRAPRFNNRIRPKGWLAPSLQHRVDGITNIVAKLRRWFPVTELHQELVRFDLQQMENPNISGDQYQQGELLGFEVREYVLERDKRTCVYCDATGLPLNLDHVHPRSRGGSNRVSNLAAACIRCNQRKTNMPLEAFVKDPKRLARIKARLKQPMNHAAAVNTTRRALYRALQETGLPVFTGSGGRTKYQRKRYGLAKTHVNDALSAGRLDAIRCTVSTALVARAAGRGTYQRSMPDKYGFPKSHRSRIKQHSGFITGDIVRAVVPRGKHRGTHIGRVAVKTKGAFLITTHRGNIESHRKHCTLIQRGNGWALTARSNP